MRTSKFCYYTHNGCVEWVAVGITCASFLHLIVLSTLILLSAPPHSNACYVYPSDVQDPCEHKECSYGAKCVPSLDGLTARCQCTERCDSFGDTYENKPVCGNDGRNYANICELHRSACREMKDIKIKYYGKCGK